MSSPSQFPRENARMEPELAAFLCRLRVCDSPAQTRLQENGDTGAEDGESISQYRSLEIILSSYISCGCDHHERHSPIVAGEPAREQLAQVARLRTLLTEMGDDIDEVAIAGYPIPYIGWDLRRHYGRVIREHGIEAATADANRRYWLQVECASIADLPDLDYPVRPRTSQTTHSRKPRLEQ